ncbi:MULTISPECIES: class I SAM-dependent methyltransferase [Janibacter]|uniref:class I SAM-dependent methyltransferase n=1 Tax=Janibacter TaxID=53457 RepID=UPI001E46E0EB|nr:class I SAM-dependent methyltransferase [Janibacter melonis]MCB5990758.1 class I SAM-dependent methyltransferase [Janibacter melonis]
MQQPASAQDVERAWEDNTLAQVLYHDWEAQTYDEKWSISFDERCTAVVRDRFERVVRGRRLPGEEVPYGRALELGAGTGFFSLNLVLAGLLREVHVTDLSPGMVEVAQENARRLGLEAHGRVADAGSLPYDDDSFDLVVGHAVLHHIPDVEATLREVLRVLRPGGRFVIAGEPTRIGHRYARALGRATWEVATRVAALPPLRARWARPQAELDESSRAAALEAVVDLHTFDPDELAETARRAGAEHVGTATEELASAVFGWPVRTFECAVREDALGLRWAIFAYRGWQRLMRVDDVLARVVPQRFFYNVGVTGVKPR